ncbi:helix-turn-helix transcriptional regulator [Nostoc sp. CENA67]|uniref:Helix-turn-helix transcriptional regulator n=1 Tax=Amazonocrinis nigriterrae CENA67 TaxID=2794033 RepID=A0A8J7HYC2_9NOST|nr:helix-turn-helix transcriptional regulator [Amazonocrinis nigriterrae]MBH8564719.1 helix-turn-helix transcriptional regulator [Amazonocrinis nigriterrae CENA67]
MARKKKPENPEDMPALQRLREAAGLTQAELASRIPDKSRKKTLSRQVISGWERGEYEPELTIPQVKALCRALGKSLEDLPDDFGPPSKEVTGS